MYSPQDAVITAVPFALAVTTPLLFTVATFVLLDSHVILSVRFVVTLRVVFVLPFVYRVLEEVFNSNLWLSNE